MEITKNERNILETVDFPFIVSLKYAFQSEAKLYLVIDNYSEINLYTYLRKRKKFTEDVIRFYMAQIVLAIEYLHSKQIIYRLD